MSWENVMYYIFWMCVCVAVVRHHANPVRHVVLLSVTCGFVFFFYKTLCETFLILRRIQRGCHKFTVHGYTRKVPVIFLVFYLNLNFLDRFSEKCSNIKFHENPVSWSRGVWCGRRDRRTDERTGRHDKHNRSFFLMCDAPCIFVYDCSYYTNICTIISFIIYPSPTCFDLAGHHQNALMMTN